MEVCLRQAIKLMQFQFISLPGTLKKPDMVAQQVERYFTMDKF